MSILIRATHELHHGRPVCCLIRKYHTHFHENVELDKKAYSSHLSDGLGLWHKSSHRITSSHEHWHPSKFTAPWIQLTCRWMHSWRYGFSSTQASFHSHEVYQKSSKIMSLRRYTCNTTVSWKDYELTWTYSDRLKQVHRISSENQINHYVTMEKSYVFGCGFNCLDPLSITKCRMSTPYLQVRHYHSSVLVAAGHNKWSKVKHKKKATDLEKSKNIHKYVTQIVSAIKTGGSSDPNANVRLASVMESARKAGVPKANIDNAIKISSSKGASSTMELMVYDAQGPSGYHLIIEAFTDNNRKTRPEIKNLLAKFSGILGEPGSSAFMFDHKGVIRVPECEIDASTDILEVAIEAGAEDVHADREVNEMDMTDELSSDPDYTDKQSTDDQQYVKFICMPSELTAVSKALQSHGYTVTSANLEYLPKSLVSLNKESYENALKLVYALCEHSNVTEVYDNFTLESSLKKPSLPAD